MNICNDECRNDIILSYIDVELYCACIFTYLTVICIMVIDVI